MINKQLQEEIEYTNKNIQNLCRQNDKSKSYYEEKISEIKKELLANQKENNIIKNESEKINEQLI